MSVETLPTFTAPANKIWSTLSHEHRKSLLADVWCSECQHEVTITNFSGAVRAGDLLLVGKCSICHGHIARVIESA